MLANSSITVIPKVKVEYLSRLKIALKIGKIVPCIGELYCHPEQEIRGHLTMMDSDSFLSFKDPPQKKKFFKVKSAGYDVGLTIILEGNNLAIL